MAETDTAPTVKAIASDMPKNMSDRCVKIVQKIVQENLKPEPFAVQLQVN